MSRLARPGPDLVVRVEAGVGHVGGEVRVVDGAERQAVRPAAAEVGEVDVLRSTLETS